MNISLPDPMRDYVQGRIESGHYASVSDYVRDLIRRDQSGVAGDETWLRDLDASLAETVAEMKAGGGIDVDSVFDSLLADMGSKTRS